MKVLLICLAMVGVFLPGPSVLEKEADFFQIWERQLKASCESDFSVKKSVFMDADETSMEVLVFALDCDKNSAKIQSTGEVVEMELSEELGAAMEYYFNDPYLKDFYEVKKDGDRTIAILKEEFWDKTPLKEQEFIFEAGSSTLKSVYSRIEKNTWFYDIEIIIKVVFDQEGKYFSHEQSTTNDILFFGSGFESTIRMEKI